MKGPWVVHHLNDGCSNEDENGNFACYCRGDLCNDPTMATTEIQKISATIGSTDATYPRCYMCSDRRGENCENNTETDQCASGSVYGNPTGEWRQRTGVNGVRCATIVSSVRGSK